MGDQSPPTSVPEDSPYTLRVGDILRSPTFKKFSVPEGENRVVGSATFGAPKGQMLIAIFLGEEPRDGSSPLDVEQRLHDIGWQRIPSEEVSLDDA